MDNTTIILVPIFILLLVIIFHAIRSASMFSGMSSFILAVCVSILAIIGMARYMDNMIDVILLPYVAMAIAILLLLLMSLVARYFQRSNKLLSKRPRKTIFPETMTSEREDNVQRGQLEKIPGVRHLSRRNRQRLKSPKSPK